MHTMLHAIRGRWQLRSSTPDRFMEVDRQRGICWDGGKYFRSGWYATNDLGVTEHEYEDDFRNCDNRGIRLRGILEHSLWQEDSSPNEIVVGFSYRGDLRVRGDVEGTCEVDLEATGSLTAWLPEEDERSYSGTICGVDAAVAAEYAELEHVRLISWSW